MSMARKSVSEADMGLAPTEAEMETAAPIEDDDISIADDPAEEPAPQSQAAEQQPEAKPADDGGKVDIRALQEARAESREARQRAAILEQRWNDFLAGQNQQQAPQAPQQAEPEIPDPDRDPAAAIKYVTGVIREAKAAQQQAAAEQQRRRTEQQAFADAFNRVNSDLAASIKADPTVVEAHNAFRTSLAQEFAALGYPQHEIPQQIAAVENQHVAYLAQSGQPPGEYLKMLAKARGWQPKAPAPTPASVPDVAALRQTQQRHLSLSDAPGGSAPAPLDAKAIAKMDDKQFKAFMRTKGAEAKLDELLGA